MLFVALSFQQATVFGVYLLNKDYITDQFCINKDKPELKCNGKCHLQDTVAQQTEQEETNTLAQNLIIPVYVSNYTLELPMPILRIAKYEAVEAVLLNAYEAKMFQPPQA